MPCGRFSNSPVLRKKGRTHFPDDQGGIAKAWHAGWHFDNSFPDNEIERRDYVRREYKIEGQIYNGLKMRIGSLAVKRIDDPQKKPIAVIVVESVNRNAFDESRVRAILDDESQRLGQMMKDLHPYIPMPQVAERIGL